MTVCERRCSAMGCCGARCATARWALAFVLGIDPVTLERWYRASRARGSAAVSVGDAAGASLRRDEWLLPRGGDARGYIQPHTLSSCGFTPARRCNLACRSVWKAPGPVIGASGA